MRIRFAIVCLAAIAGAAGCCASPGRQPATVSPVQHVVIFWLKNPGDQAARRQIVETSKTFTEIPGVLEVRAGTVVPSERPIVDSSFDVAILMTFKDAASMTAYLDDPIHQKAMKDVLTPHVKKILVYDFAQ